VPHLQPPAVQVHVGLDEVGPPAEGVDEQLQVVAVPVRDVQVRDHGERAMRIATTRPVRATIAPSTASIT
jgi:hypothetical protein